MLKLKKINSVFLIFLILFLTGCYDKVELENRAFVISVGIDKGKDKRFNVILDIPDLKKDSERTNISLSESDDTIYSAMNEVDANISKKIYYGQTKFVVIGNDILENDILFREVVDALERNTEISRKIVVLVSDKKAEEILKGEVEEKSMVGNFISDYFMNYETKSRKIFKQSIEDVVSQLRNSSSAIIPKITLEDKKIRIGGAVVMKDYKKVGILGEESLNGYLFFKDLAKGTSILSEFNGINIPIKITKAETNIECSEKDGQLICDIDIACEGKVEEYIFGEKGLGNENEKAKLEKQFEKIITDDIFALNDKFAKDFKVDGFGIQEILRKYNFEIFKKYENEIEEKIREILLRPKVKIEIESTGSIK